MNLNAGRVRDKGVWTSVWPIGPLRGIMLFMGGAGFAIGWSVRRRSTAETHDLPSSAAGARSHDGAPPGLWIAVALWPGAVSAGGAACGDGLSMFWTNVRARRPA